jgi:hypothetical protein
MLRLLAKVVLAGAALAALWLWVPIAGHTLAERWRAAGSPAEFAERGLAELRGRASASSSRARAGARLPARTPGTSRERPVERHTDADRRALDRVLSQHLDEAR